MKQLKTTLCLMAALTLPALAGPNRRIPIQGEWDQDNPNEFRTSLELRLDRSYTIQNNTDQTVYVMLVELDSTPREYFPLLPGYSQQFGATWNIQGESYSLDLFLDAGTKLNGNAITLREGPEMATN